MHPDFELLLLGGDLMFEWQRQTAYFATRGDCSHSECERAIEPCSRLVDKIELLSAATMDGLRVKALALAWCREDDGEVDLSSFMDGSATDSRIIGGILQDLLVMTMMRTPMGSGAALRPAGSGLPRLTRS